MGHENRDRCLLNNIRRRAAQDELLQPHMPVGAHHHHVSAQIGEQGVLQRYPGVPKECPPRPH